MIDNRQTDRGIFIGRNEQQMSRTRQVNKLHLSHRESLSHNAKKNINWSTSIPAWPWSQLRFRKHQRRFRRHYFYE